MATKQMKKVDKGTNGRSRIPLFQYLRFRLSKKTELLNERIIGRELGKEARIVEQLEKTGELRPDNGLKMFLEACKRRLRNRTWHRVLEHSENVRRYAYCIAKAWEQQKEEKGLPGDDVLLHVVKEVSGYHDIGKTLIAPYLINREDGTWLGIGKGQRIDLEELHVLRLSHLNVGMRFLALYQDFIDPREFQMARWIIEGHHLAHDGQGTASAPSYPQKMVDGVRTEDYIRELGLPEVARIMRTADVYSAIMENRFYLAESERVMTMVTGIAADDAALGLLITVAGTDVDPEMVKCLMTGKYGISASAAEAALIDLACREPDCLRTRGGDIKFSLERVMPEQTFLDIIRTRNTGWEFDTGIRSSCAAGLA